MKFYLAVFVLFGLFIAGAREFPRLTEWMRKQDLERRAKEHILAGVKDPSTVKWNAKSNVAKGGTKILTFDVTADKTEGGVVREVWTFEFDAESKDLLSAKQSAGPRLQFNELAPVK